MEKLSKRKTRVNMICSVIGGILLILGVLLQNTTSYLVGAGFLFIGIILMIAVNRCPYCGELFRGASWSKKDAGFCRKCGKKMEYDF